jgi:hypothetical protein
MPLLSGVMFIENTGFGKGPVGSIGKSRPPANALSRTSGWEPPPSCSMSHTVWQSMHGAAMPAR